MKILSVGGGSGGHVTPVVAVLREITKKNPRLEVRFWCDRGFAGDARSIMADFDPTIPVQTVWAGKFRRYSNLSKLQHLIIPSIIFPNIRDFFLVIFGIGQSVFRLLAWRPHVVFAKGGFVCLPVGIAARLLGIPVIVHDSDAHPGLTNRLLAPFATKIATGMPLEYYHYPPSKSVYVGTPIDASFKVLTDAKRKEVKKDLGFDANRPMVVCVGGGQGSTTINQAIAKNLQVLMPLANIVLVSGSTHYDEIHALTPDDPRFLLKDFVSSGMSDLVGAADIVIARAGASTLLELAAVARPTLLVPSKRLRWQIKHARYFEEKGSVIILDEDLFSQPADTSVVDAVSKLLKNTKRAKELADRLHEQAKPNAARDMAELILKNAKQN